MSFLKRLGYYMGGFSVGLIILAFILSQKNFSCSYGPNARVLKNIRSKELKYADGIEKLMVEKAIDTGDIGNLLRYGDVNFSESDTKSEPCRYYLIEGVSKKASDIVIKVENCDSIATLQEFYLKD